MSLKDKIVGMIKRSFGIKALTSIDEIENIDTYGLYSTENSINSATSDKKYSENQFDESLKVDPSAISVAPNFEKLSAEIKAELLDSFEEFKQTVLENDDIKRIKQSQEEGQMGDTPFICFAELDSNGKLKSTIIVTKNSCIKTTEENDGSISYQETRKDKDGYQTIINDNRGSMYIKGNNLTQSQINELKDFSYKSEDNITKLPSKFDDETKSIYKQTLESLGVKTDIDVKNKEKYKYLASGKYHRNLDTGEFESLDEMCCIFDKESNSEKPEIIAINTKKEGKISSRKFRLTENGKYIDESSFKIVDGKPEYSLVDYEQIKQYGKQKEIDVNYMDRYNKFNSQNKPLIPEAAVNIHNAMGRKQEREQQPQYEDDKTL